MTVSVQFSPKWYCYMLSSGAHPWATVYTNVSGTSPEFNDGQSLDLPRSKEKWEEFVTEDQKICWASGLIFPFENYVWHHGEYRDCLLIWQCDDQLGRVEPSQVELQGTHVVRIKNKPVPNSKRRQQQSDLLWNRCQQGQVQGQSRLLIDTIYILICGELPTIIAP
jgi:hypothetical protein